MSHIVININDKELHDIIAKATKDGYIKGREEVNRESMIDDDIITEDEALKLLGCSKSKLAKMRANKEIVFYTVSRPFSYSKKSVLGAIR